MVVEHEIVVKVGSVYAVTGVLAVVRNVLRVAGLTLAIGVVATGPFFQGLFFPHQQHVAQTVLGIGFVLWLIGRRSSSPGLVHWRDPLLVASAALLVIYLLAFFTAVYPQGNLEVLLNVTAGLLILVMIRTEAAATVRFRTVLAWVLAIAGAVEALVSLAPYIGVARLDQQTLKALALVGGDGRLGGSFQYWNTAAIYFLAVAFVLVGLTLEQAPRPVALILCGALGYAPLLAFVLAASRGAMLVLPVAVALLLIGLPRDRRLQALLLLLMMAAPALAASRGMAANSVLHDTPRVLKWYAAGQVAALLGGAALAWWWGWKARQKLAAVCGAILLVVALAGWVTWRLGGVAAAVGRILPAQSQRLLDVTWRTPNALIRLHYDRDALRILRDRPLLGAGGRSWERLYFRYQDFFYYATEVHDSYLQVAVEAGLPGLLALLTFAAATLYVGWRSRRAPEGGVVIWCMTAAAGAILLHSAVDFNLSFLSIVLFTYALAAVAAAEPLPPSRGWIRSATVALVMVFTLVSATQAVAAISVERGNALLSSGHSAQARVWFARGSRWAPLSATARSGLARADAGQPDELTLLDAAIRRDPENYRYYAEKASAYRHLSNFKAATNAALQALARQPSYYLNYEPVMDGLVAEAVNSVLHGERANGLARAQQARALGESLLRRRDQSVGQDNLWFNARPELTPRLQLRYGQALALTGDLERALGHLALAAQSPPLLIEADVWTAVTERKLGRALSPGLANKPWVRALPINPLQRVLDGV